MNGKLAGMSEKSDFEIFVKPLFHFFLFSWQWIFEIKPRITMPLNLLLEERSPLDFTEVKASSSFICCVGRGEAGCP